MSSPPLPPPLAPMQRRLSETQSAADGASYHGLQPILTVGGGDDSKERGYYHQAVSQEEHMETGIGVHQDDDDELLSLQPSQQTSTSTTTGAGGTGGPCTTTPAPAPAPAGGRISPKRTSLIERSREFREKLVYFMKDCEDEEDTDDDYQGMEKVDLEGSNRFPTRAIDLRHVDQSSNLMDASSARFEWREDEEAREVYVKDDNDDEQCPHQEVGTDDDQYDPEEGGDDDDPYYDQEEECCEEDYNYEEYDDEYYCEDDDSDVYAGYTQGYNTSEAAATNKEEQGEPPIAGCGGLKLAIDHEEECDVVKMEKRLSTILMTKNRRGDNLKKLKSIVGCDWSCGLILLMLCISAILFSSMEIFRGGNNRNNDYAISPSNHLPPPSPQMPPNKEPAPLVEPAMLPANADNLPPGMGHNKGDVSRRKHVLDHIVEEELIKGSHSVVLNPSHPSAKKAITWMTTYDPLSMKLLDEFDFHPSDEQSDKLRKGEDIDAPSNHAMKIIDRYVEVVFYFESHPQATPETANVP